MERNLKSSENPVVAIGKVAYKGQPEFLRQYEPGYEEMFNNIPLPNDENLDEVRGKITAMAAKVRNSPFAKENLPEPGLFNRTILSIEEPTYDEKGKIVPGIEIIVSKWGDGFATPIHGHKSGFMHEEVLNGKIVEDSFRVADAMGMIVRPIERIIFETGTLISTLKKDKGGKTGRYHLAHALKSIGQSATFHYIGEHSSDGRDNRLTAEYFDEWYGPTILNELTRTTLQSAMKSEVGEVALVRSKNVPDYGDHYVITTGALVQKPHGLRPEDRVIPCGESATQILDSKEYDENGLIILRLSLEATEQFYAFHDIKIRENKVVFPEW